MAQINSYAVVGSGIGGSACSYFLRELMQDAIDIDLYEANEIGGRLATVEYQKMVYETGGCVVHERNKYMNSFREKLELQKLDDDANVRWIIRDASGFKFTSSNVAIFTLAKMIWQYGFMSLFRLRRFIDHLLNEFDKIYELQEQGKSFATVEELFAEANPEFLSYFNISAKNGFLNNVHLNEETIDDLVRATLRVNYGQSTDVSLFLSAVSVAGMFGNLWSFKGSNRQVPELLVQESGVNFLNQRVTEITFHEAARKYTLESVPKASNEKLTKTYDAVILANPITADSKTPIRFNNFSKPIVVAGRYHRTVATLVFGNLNASYFNLIREKIPDFIINNDCRDIINCVSKISPVTSTKKAKTNVWKIFSQRPLLNEELNLLFQKPKIIEVKDWLAYPKYEKLMNLSNEFTLHDRLFYVNAIEWAASAMEMSVIGAKNVALLVQKKLFVDKVKSTVKIMKEEL